ncbi:MAG TPA: FAD-binding monooxygenase [Pseudonocardia sp.]|jgi:2-polyprenyl-6-methoxyphenol hydroxylase-like FAD-dependent oxidoreductase
MTAEADHMGRTAIVCGAGMAGLLSARVLSDFYDQVVIVERDELLDQPLPRRGVPQGGHGHTLLVGGQRILSELFPGFVEEMVAHGAPYVCYTSSRKRYQSNGWAPRPESDLWTLQCTRSHLEWGVRRRVLKLPNVTVLDGRRIVDLAASVSDDRATVGGVRAKLVAGGDPTTISGDVVVDATGRTSAGPRWLAGLGYPVPEEVAVNGFWGYASRLYRMPDDWAPDCAGLVSFPTGRNGNTRGAGWARQEHNRWLLMLIGCARDYPPRDERGFTDWLTSLPVPDFAEPLAGATPLNDIEVWRQTSNRLRRYDRLERRPANLLFTGDSVCALNPVYGQGMSVACLGARELRAALSEGGHDLADRFQHRLADAIQFSWAASTSADRAMPGFEGNPPDVEEAELGRRWQRAAALSTDVPEVLRLFWETACLVRGPDWLFTGSIASRVSG